MDEESDLLLERKDGKRKTVLESSDLCYEGAKKPESSGSNSWLTIKRILPSCLNVVIYFLAGPYVLQAPYSTYQGDHWYSNFLMPYALVCYGLGTALGVVLTFTEGNLLSQYFPKKYANRKITLQEFQDIGQAGFWNNWVVTFCMCFYVELTASIVGRFNGLNGVIVELYPGFRGFTLTTTGLEPSTFLVVLWMSVMVLPMWHKSKFDLTWFALSPLFIANKFPWGFPIYRIMVGTSSIYVKLVELHKEHLEAKSAAQKQFARVPL